MILNVFTAPPLKTIETESYCTSSLDLNLSIFLPQLPLAEIMWVHCDVEVHINLLNKKEKLTEPSGGG